MPRSFRPRVSRAASNFRKNRRDVFVCRIVVQDLIAKPLEGAVVDDRQNTERAVVQFVGSDVAGEVAERPVQIRRLDLAGRLFSPGLHPVLNRGMRDEDAMVTPQMPTGGLIGQAVLHHQAHGQRHHPVGIVGLGPGQVRHVGVEVLTAVGAMMLRIAEMDLTWPPRDPVPQVAQQTGDHSVSGATLAATGTRSTFEIPAPFNDLRLGKILGVGDPFGGVGQILSRTRHGKSLLWTATPVRQITGFAQAGHDQFPGFVATDLTNPGAGVARR